ncbi:hypothetical protein TNCV_1907311 [Trichonephila clavipes]|nr:hypothetical protein TNCV_1907311 [Trichonephila clavipes]
MYTIDHDAGPHHDTACRISAGYFLDDKQYHSHARSSWRTDGLNLLSSENYACPVLFSPKCSTPMQTGSTVLSGQWDRSACV